MVALSRQGIMGRDEKKVKEASSTVRILLFLMMGIELQKFLARYGVHQRWEVCEIGKPLSVEKALVSFLTSLLQWYGNQVL